MNYTADQLKEAATETTVTAVLSGLGVVPSVRIPMSNDFLDMPLEILDLSTRAWNALMRPGIATIRSLVSRLRDQDGLSTIRNLGKHSAAEIKSKLVEAAYLRLNDRERTEFWQYFIDNSNSIPRSQLYAEA